MFPPINFGPNLSTTPENKHHSPRFTDQWFTIDLFANGQRQPLWHWPNPAENIRGVNDPGWTTCNGSKSSDAFFFGAGGQPDDKDATDELDLETGGFTNHGRKGIFATRISSSNAVDERVALVWKKQPPSFPGQTKNHHRINL